MRSDRKLIKIVAVFVLALLYGPLFLGAAHESQTRLAHANGNGTLRVGDEEFKIYSAIVKLLPDHKAEITLGSEITIFLSATWSNNAEAGHKYDLEITGGASPGGLDGTGSVSLSDDDKSVKRLSLKGVSRTTKRTVEADFEGK